jgi:predicted glycosyltransferase
VLGIRDVMDEPALLVPEWERKGARTVLIRYYDEIWVYGLRDVYQPLKALDLPPEVESRSARSSTGTGAAPSWSASPASRSST